MAMNENTKIILAEDDDGHAFLIDKNLKRAGINNEIIRFINGEDLLQYLETLANSDADDSHIPYLLLLDIRMPKIDGYQVLKKIRSNRALYGMLIVMLTTTEDAQEIDNCYKAGCNFYLAKPIDYNKFKEMIFNFGNFLKHLSIPALKHTTE